MKQSLHLLFACLLYFSGYQTIAQNDCPAYSMYATFEKSCFISANTPDTESKGQGLWLPQASFDGKFGQSPNKARIPDNRKTWAISIAHAWNYSRNITQQTAYPKMSYWMATVTQESEWRCDATAKWGTFTGSPVGMPWQNMWSDGCFQIEGQNNSSAYGTLMAYYPLRFRKNEHQNLIGGDNFETAALTKAFYDLATERIATYRWGWNWFPAVQKTCDVYAHEKLLAAAYNGGIYSFQNAKSFMTGQEKNCNWTGLPSATAGYSNNIADMMSVLENNKTYPVTSFKQATSTFDGYYNEAITWADMEEYLAEIDDLYHEINFATQVTPSVKAAFVKIAGSDKGTILFTQLGSVIDAIILALPKEDPMQTALTSDYIPQGPKGLACSGNVVPVASIQVEGETTLCAGMSVILKAKIQDDNNYTVKWKLDGNVVATTKTFVVTKPAGKYSYSLEVCNAANCYTASCGVTIAVDNCMNTCGLEITSTPKNATCQTNYDGEMAITMKNGSGNYFVEYTSKSQSGTYTATTNAFTIKNLRAGVYNVRVSDIASKSCTAYQTVTVNYTTASNSELSIEKAKQADCSANLMAKMKNIELPKQWKIKVYQPLYFDWENYVAILIKKEGQVTRLQAKEVGANPWEKVGNYTTNLMTGDSVTVYLLLENTPGASQMREVKVEFYNEKNELKNTYTIPAQTVTENTPNLYKAGTYLIQNTIETPVYTYQWTPSAGVQSPLLASTTVNAVKPLGQTYSVMVSNQAKTCVFKDSIAVKYNCTRLCSDFKVDKFGSMVEYKVCQNQPYEKMMTATGLNLSYQWFKDDKIYANTTNTLSFGNATIKDNGIYYLKVTDACNQEDITHNIKITVDVCTNTDEKIQSNITVYPNPTSGKVIIESTEVIEEVVLFSIQGEKIQVIENKNEIDITNCNSGTYLLKIKTNHQTIYRKIQKL